MQFSITKESGRSDWSEVFKAIHAAVHHGDSASVHCMVGRHRGGTTGVMARTQLAGETFEARGGRAGGAAEEEHRCVPGFAW